ncbi:hypothetical protein LINPERPRIM_LOCUS13768 [Linum perenne]
MKSLKYLVRLLLCSRSHPSMAAQVRPVSSPENRVPTVSLILVVEALAKAREAVRFYETVFDADMLGVYVEGNPQTINAKIQLCGSSISLYVANEFLPVPQEAGQLLVFTDDLEGLNAKAIDAGATRVGYIEAADGTECGVCLKDPVGACVFHVIRRSAGTRGWQIID